jgi:hypothetical protein
MDVQFWTLATCIMTHDSVKKNRFSYLNNYHVNILIFVVRVLMNWIDKYKLLNAIWVVGLWPIGCWNRVFKSHWKHECSSLVFIMFGVGNVLCDGLFTHPEEPYCVCLILCALEISTASRPGPDLDWCATGHKYKQTNKQGVVGGKKV